MPKPPPPPPRRTVTDPSEGRPVRLTDAWLVAVDQIQPNPWQPRQHTDATAMQELIADIKARGIMLPLLVRPLDDDTYQVIAGGRRYAAAVAAGLTQVPVRVQAMSDTEAQDASIRENVQREQMDPEDEGRYYIFLRDSRQGLSLRDIGAAIGKSHMYVQRRITLVEKPGALAAYRAGEANLFDLVGGWEAPEPMPLDTITINGRPTVTDSYSPQSPSDTVTDSYNPPAGAVPVTDSYSSARPVQRRPAIYKPFHTLHQHMARLDPQALDADERQHLRTTIEQIQTQLEHLKAQLGEE